MKLQRYCLLSLLVCILFIPYETNILFIFGIEIEYFRYAICLIVGLLFVLLIMQYRPDSNYLGKKVFYYLMLIWSIFILINTIPSFQLEDRKIKVFITDSFIKLLIPFLLCIDFSKWLGTIRRFLIISTFIAISAISLFYVNNGINIEYISYAFATPLGIRLFYFRFEKKEKSLFLIALLILFLVPNLMIGRRAASLYLAFLIIYSIIVNIRPSTVGGGAKKNTTKSLSFIFMAIVIFFAAYAFQSVFDVFLFRMNYGFESRETVIEDFVNDFNFNGGWVVGRGLLGEVEGGVLATNAARGTRELVENGWLLYVLRGGIIYAVLFFIIGIESIYNAFFKAKNSFCKIIAVYVLYAFIDMIGFGANFIDAKTFFLFFAISCCHSKRMLELTDENIYSLYQQK